MLLYNKVRPTVEERRGNYMRPHLALCMGFQRSWLLYCYNSRVRKWDRECRAHKVESIYCLALYRQGFSSPLYRIQ